VKRAPLPCTSFRMRKDTFGRELLSAAGYGLWWTTTVLWDNLKGTITRRCHNAIAADGQLQTAAQQLNGKAFDGGIHDGWRDLLRECGLLIYYSGGRHCVPCH
jgi:hypothetical protein